MSPATLANRTERVLLAIATVFVVLQTFLLSASPLVRTRQAVQIFDLQPWIGASIWILVAWSVHILLSRQLPNRDPFIFPTAMFLAGLGFLAIWRITPDFGLRQVIWLFFGGLAIVITVRILADLANLRRYKYLLLFSGILLTAATLVFGVNPSGLGAEQWLGCCGLYLQPSEPLKLLLVAYLAAYLADLPKLDDKTKLWRQLLPLLAPTIFMTGLALLVLVVQRDLGTASIFLFVFAGVLYLATEKRAVLALTVIVLIVTAVAGYQVFDVVQLRVDIWLDPFQDATGQGYQIVQSLIAIANGGLLGRGAGLGSPALVPLSHSDFVFSTIVEEGGLVAGLSVLAALMLLLHRGLRISIMASDRYRRYLAGGLTLYLLVQGLLIIAGNIRLLPLTGVTLPFVSYGGSSLLTAFFSLAVLLIISADEGSTRSVRDSQPLSSGPVVRLGSVMLFMIGLTAVWLTWISVFTGPTLLARDDNARPAIADVYSPRGHIFDRYDQPLAQNMGSSGDFQRRYASPLYSQVLGYSDVLFGQAGLEASLDAFLRGSNPGRQALIAQEHLIYGQHPAGTDVRLSLDSRLTRQAAPLLTTDPGALIVLNAESGELLVMLSNPIFDNNNLETSLPEALADDSAPLLNRVTQGAYPPGMAIGPLILALRSDVLPPVPGETSYSTADMSFECATEPEEDDWGALIQAGCPGGLARLMLGRGSQELASLFGVLGFYSPPNLRLPAFSPAQAESRGPTVDDLLQFDGEREPIWSLSPLQMALAVATISNAGVRPAPRLLTAVSDSEGSWVPMPPLGNPITIFSETEAAATAGHLLSEAGPYWEAIALAGTPQAPVTWYLAGTLPDWPGAPVVIVLVAENDDVSGTLAIGRQVISLAMGDSD
jgi:cell division protein FtsW (lipid II flippase)